MATYLVAGAYIMQVAILDDDNFPMGTLVTPDAPVAGTEYHPYVVPALVEFAPSQPTYANAFSYAGQKIRGRRPLGATDYGIGTVTLSEFDDVFDALVMGHTIDTTTATNIRVTGTNAMRVQQRRFMVAFTGGATPSDSLPNYTTIVELNVYFERQPSGLNQNGGQNPNNVVYNMYVNTSPRTAWGELQSAATVNVDGDADTEMRLYYSAPFMFSTYVDDGAETTYSLPYTPSSTEHAGATNIFFQEGSIAHAQVSGVSGTTVTKTAQDSGDRWVTWFPSTGAL